MSILPPDDDLELLHQRDYEVRVYAHGNDAMLARGAIQDRKSPGLYIADDDQPVVLHRMQIEMVVAIDGLEITSAKVGFEAHPQPGCPSIADRYEQLVGLNVARGFTHKVRELFGGPRGCTHTTALLQAMGPAVVQSTWSAMARRLKARIEAGEEGVDADEARRARMPQNIDTCHLWAADGAFVEGIRNGRFPPPPLPVIERLTVLGRDPDDWTLGS